MSGWVVSTRVLIENENENELMVTLNMTNDHDHDSDDDNAVESPNNTSFHVELNGSVHPVQYKKSRGKDFILSLIT